MEIYKEALLMKRNLIVGVCMMSINTQVQKQHAIRDHDWYLDIVQYLRLKKKHTQLSEAGLASIFKHNWERKAPTLVGLLVESSKKM